MHGLRDVVQELGFLARPRLGVEGADHQALDQAGGGGVLQREHAPHYLRPPGRRDVRDVHNKLAGVDNDCRCSTNLTSQIRITNDSIIIHLHYIFNGLAFASPTFRNAY